MDYNEGVFMSKEGSFNFEITTQFLSGKLNRKEASKLMGVTERTVSNRARRVEKKGIFGAVHANRGREPVNKTKGYVKKAVMDLVEKKYFDFNITHCLEKLEEEHGIGIKYQTLRRWCHEKHLVKRPKRRKSLARTRRERMPNPGLLIQMDGSPEKYNGRHVWHLIAALDDATSEIPSAEFFLSEDTLNVMKVLQNLIEKKGIPLALYVDKAGCFGGGNRTKFNQFIRACSELGIKVIPANSAEAKGRIERTFGTFQDRIIPELRLYYIWTREKANAYLKEKFLPNYWDRKNTVPPKNPESKYRLIPPELDLKEILCLKDYRRVNGDHTINWQGKVYQLIWIKKHSIRGRLIEIRTYQDRSWKAFFVNEPIQVTEWDKRTVATLLPKQNASYKVLNIKYKKRMKHAARIQKSTLTKQIKHSYITR